MNDDEQPKRPPDEGDAMSEDRDIPERGSRSNQHRTGEKQAEENRQNESPA
jgi:hypothetical protein